MTWLSITTLAACMAVSLTVTWVVRAVANRRGLLDRPNDRSAHVRPTPRLGGIGLMVAFVAGAITVLSSRGGTTAGTVAIIAATVAISAVGLIDDLRPLSSRVRLGAQLAAATVVVAFNVDRVEASWTLVPAPAWILVPASVVWIVWLTNLYNFMDGIDGLAGGQAVLAGTAIAAAGFAAGSPVQGALALALAASAAGFLVFNLPPASIFMGDVGSTAIGFFFAAIPFLPGRSGVPVETVAIVLSLFVLDATVTLVRRIVRGERFLKAHRTHLYQRPLALGIPHTVITMSAYPGMAIVGAGGVLYIGASAAGRAALIAIAIAVFLAYAGLVVRMERRSGAAMAGGRPTS